MIEAIKKYPEMCLEAIKIVKNIDLQEWKFDKIIISGMGGSALAGDFVKDLLKDSLTLPIEIFREYHLPAYADENTLVFCASYSGNTEETLSQFVDAIKRKCKIISITSGGKLKEWSQKFDIPMIMIPEGYQPRATVPYFLYSILSCLQKFGLINFEKEMKESIGILKSVDLNQFDPIALSLKGCIPAIYASSDMFGVIRKMKVWFNETSKVPARIEVFPEFSHNEMVSYEGDLNRNFYVIFVRTNDEGEEVKARIDFAKRLMEGKVKGIYELWAKGNSKLEKMMFLTYIGDYLSYKIAELNGIDPTTTKSITDLKNELKDKINLVEKLERRLEID